jgi:hypothetical protein
MQVGNATTPATVFFRNNISLKATLFEPEQPPVLEELDLPLQKAPGDRSASDVRNLLSMPGINEYQSQLEKQGQMEQSMVISKRGQVVGAVGRNGEAMFQESSIQGLWQKANSNPADFAQLLRQQGYQVETYQPGVGPNYAGVHEMIHHESYETLIARQSVEYCRELSSWSGCSAY